MKFISRIFTILLFLLVLVLGFFLFVKIDENNSNEKEVINDTIITNKQNALSFSDFSGEIKKISDNANPSILWIESNDGSDSFGTGFVFEYNDKKYVLTNYHVVQKSKSVPAYLLDDEEINLTLVGFDIELDLAVLSFDKNVNIPPLELMTSNKLQVGDFVLAIGHPLGLDYTTTFGIVSALDRELELEYNYFTGLIQTDAAINPGNSGGPLLNMQGKVIGINTAVMEDSQGLGFAVSSTDIIAILPELIEKGKVERPFLGVTTADTEEGVLIIEIIENSPASKSGLIADDIILSINGVALSDAESLSVIFDKFNVGSELQITIKRNGEVLSKEAILGDKNEILNNI